MKKIIALASLTVLTQLAFSQTPNVAPVPNLTNDTSSVFQEFSQLKKVYDVSPEYAVILKNEAATYINQTPDTFDKTISQYFILVDSAFKQQNLIIAYWDATTQTYQLSPNMTKVSTGRTGSKQHFITPIGWVEQTPENGTYRAQGTKNENGIRGIGAKGMRVWDFGWQNAYTGWLKTPEVRQIRLEMHATDPQFLEQRLGNPASEACVRISAETNQFIDKHALMDRKIETSSLAWVLRKDRTPVANEGSFVLIINTDPTSIAHNLQSALAISPVDSVTTSVTTPVSTTPEVKPTAK